MWSRVGPGRGGTGAGYTTGDSDVSVVTRIAKGGVLYAFVRNASGTERKEGLLKPDGTIPKAVAMPYRLDPLEAIVLRLAPDGTIDVLPGIEAERAPTLPAPIRLSEAEAVRLQPSNWRSTAGKSSVQALGIYDSRFVAYRLSGSVAAPGGLLSVRAAGGDASAWRDGEFVRPTATSRRGAAYDSSPTGLTMLYLNPGWPNGGAGMEAPHGIASAAVVKQAAQEIVLSHWEKRSIDGPGDADALARAAGEGWQPSASLSVPSRSYAVLRTTFNRPAKPGGWKLDFDGIDDEGWVYLNGERIGETHRWDEPLTLDVAKSLKPGANTLVIVVHNNDGEGGIAGRPRLTTGEEGASGNSRLEWTDNFEPVGSSTPYKLHDLALQRIARPGIVAGDPVGTGPLVRSWVTFDGPDTKRAAWEMIVDAGGDGFLSLNGHPLGRFWQVGPQRAFYLPECWLKPKGNVLELTATPGTLGDRIKAAELRPLAK